MERIDSKKYYKALQGSFLTEDDRLEFIERMDNPLWEAFMENEKMFEIATIDQYLPFIYFAQSRVGVEVDKGRMVKELGWNLSSRLERKEEIVDKEEFIVAATECMCAGQKADILDELMQIIIDDARGNLNMTLGDKLVDCLRNVLYTSADCNYVKNYLKLKEYNAIVVEGFIKTK